MASASARRVTTLSVILVECVLPTSSMTPSTGSADLNAFIMKFGMPLSAPAAACLTSTMLTASAHSATLPLKSTTKNQAVVTVSKGITRSTDRDARESVHLSVTKTKTL